MINQRKELTMLRVGVIGLGAIGQEHLAIYRHIPGVEVTAVADFDKARADEAAELAEAYAFGSAAELLESGLVDAVSLCTPDHLHASDAAAVMRAGVHLLLEKPIATTVEEADDLVELSELSGLVVMPGHTLRFENKYATSQSIVGSGGIGDVVHGYLRRNNKVSVAERVKGRTSVTFFLGIHDLDALMWITGQKVTAVQAIESNHRTPDGRQAVAVDANLRLSGGAVVQLEAAWGLPDEYPTDIDARLRLVGTSGEVAIDIYEQGMRAFSDALSYPVPVALPIYGAPQGALKEEIDAFVRAVRGEIAVPVTMAEAADAVRVAFAIDRAVRTGRTEEIEYAK
jgi:UDP-N-acetylglucosamine 3-dehydrogenase